jgi:REP element-mobilizing transposase RayT
MPSTHLSLHYHIVFSTKGRQHFIEPDWRDRLHSFLGGTIKTAGGVPLAINGTRDHVHLLIGLRATHRLADFVQDIKQTSSQWIHQRIGLRQFSWQTGYGAFTVSASNVVAVTKYIDHQEEHHRTKTFQEEYVAFLEKHGVKYEERFLW